MAYENLCMYCFRDLNGAGICPHCGKDSRAAVPQIQMLPGTLVYRDRFLVGRALGQDAGGIVYTALDTRKGGAIRIREYLPRNCAERLNDGGVVPLPGMEDAFEAGMRKLRASVESVEDPKKRHFYFEENGTAYIAQRKNTKGSAMPYDDDMDDEDEGRGRSVALYIAIAAAVVVVIAIAIIWFLNSMSEPSDVTIDQPLPTVSAEATWKPAETPTPTPYATATFAALVDPELSWMDYTYSGDVEADFEKQQASVQVTKKPTIITEEDFGTVSSSSNKQNVEELQERLAKLGWLNYYDITGKYDTATKNAVKEFQRYVNDYCSPATKLAVDGIAGSKTQQWLYNSSVSLTKPTATPEPVVTAKPDSAVIDANSSRSEIRALQNQLITLGLMEEGSADGRFGSTTKNAVKKFQMRVNQIQGYDALNVSGAVDELTQAYLDYYVEDWMNRQEEESKPTATLKPTATPEPTEAPETGLVNADSSKKEIIAVQEMLMDVGLLKRGDVDGVYGRGTVSAVKEFQKWVNEMRGTETLEVTGECDLLTQRYLQYCIENGMLVNEPTQKPTAAPEPTEEPDEGNVVVDQSSPKESIAFVQEMLMTVRLLDDSDVDGNYGKKTVSAVKEFQRFVNDYYGTEKVKVTGLCDQTTLQYLEYAYTNEWEIGSLGKEEATPEPTQAPTPEPESDNSQITVNADSTKKQVREVQQMLAGVGLLKNSDVDGGYGKKTANAVKALQQYVNQQKGEIVLEVTGECDPLTRKYLEYCNENGIDVGAAMNKPDPTEPPRQEPAVSEVRGFTVEVDERETNGYVEMESGKHSFSWSAKSGVDSFHVYFYDGNGGLVNSKTSSKAGSVTIKASDLEPGEIYRLEIGALPEGGSETDIIWETIRITRPAQAKPDPTKEPEKASVGKPVINLGSTAYQKDGIPYISDDFVIFNWMAEGDVDYYIATLYYENGDDWSLGETRDTSKSVPVSQLEPGLWKLEVGAMPAGGGRDDMKWTELIFGVPAPEIPDEPEAEPDSGVPGSDTLIYIDGNSPSEDIQLVQMALYKYGLINADAATLGSLDEATLEAVILFQEMVNDLYGLNLEVIDLDAEGEIYIDEHTLDCLLYRELELH